MVWPASPWVIEALGDTAGAQVRRAPGGLAPGAVRRPERARWKQAADKREQPFATWARDTLKSEADRVLGPGDAKPRAKKP